MGTTNWRVKPRKGWRSGTEVKVPLGRFFQAYYIPQIVGCPKKKIVVEGGRKVLIHERVQSQIVLTLLLVHKKVKTICQNKGFAFYLDSYPGWMEKGCSLKGLLIHGIKVLQQQSALVHYILLSILLFICCGVENILAHNRQEAGCVLDKLLVYYKISPEFAASLSLAELYNYI